MIYTAKCVRKKVLIHFVKCSPNPSKFTASVIKSLEIESKALQESNANKYPALSDIFK